LSYTGEQAETIVGAKFANSNWGFQYKSWYALNSTNRYSKQEWDTEESAHIKLKKKTEKHTRARFKTSMIYLIQVFLILVNELH
jgi:hypothetical protein